MKRRVWLIVCSLLIICVIWYDHSSRSHPVNTEINLNNILSNQGDQDFARADKPRTFNFPDDHFAHPEYRIEWWYLTGNLSSDTGHQFGYQITFFRTALKSKPAQRESKWASHQIWMAHLAVSDVNQQQHYQTQRLSRPAIGLAGIQQQPFKIWLEDWQITGVGNGNFPWHIIAKDQKISLDLTVNPLKPAVLQGNQGLSQKSSEPGNASYYYSFTRMDSTGTIKVNHKTYKVKGLSWLDREWSTSALDKNQSGWDWFSLQLNTGEELMFYRLRSKTGDSDQQSQGKWIHADGKTISLTVNDVTLEPLSYWRTEKGKNYPVSWKLTIPHLAKTFTIKAAIKDQLMRTSFEYWEGSVDVFQSGSLDLVGKGYLEMTGY